MTATAISQLTALHMRGKIRFGLIKMPVRRWLLSNLDRQVSGFGIHNGFTWQKKTGIVATANTRTFAGTKAMQVAEYAGRLSMKS
jgi:hypothetical protein